MPDIDLIKHQDPTVFQNRYLTDKNLSFKAKGILSLMLSLPKDWNYTVSSLSNVSKDKKSSVMAGLKELEDNKYLVREQARDSSGKFEGSIYTINI